METESSTSTTNYEEDFDGNWYLDMFYSKLEGCEEEGDFLVFMLKTLHEIFRTGSLTGKTLLDIGTGPTVHSVISACPYVREIYLSDYAETNRRILQDWLDGKREIGTELCKFILDLENNKYDQRVKDRFTEIRHKIKAILPVDVMKRPPIEFKDPTSLDIIISSLCFEAASQTVTEYNQIVENVATLLSSGSQLIIVGVLEQTFYRVGDFKFQCLYINQSELQNVYETNGFQIKSWKEYIPPPRNETEAEFSDFQKAFIMHATKT